MASSITFCFGTDILQILIIPCVNKHVVPSLARFTRPPLGFECSAGHAKRIGASRLSVECFFPDDPYMTTFKFREIKGVFTLANRRINLIYLSFY